MPPFLFLLQHCFQATLFITASKNIIIPYHRTIVWASWKDVCILFLWKMENKKSIYRGKCDMPHIALCLATSWQTVQPGDLCSRCQDCISGCKGVYFYVTILNSALWISVIMESLKIKIKWSIFFYLSFKNIWNLTNLLKCF